MDGLSRLVNLRRIWAVDRFDDESLDHRPYFEQNFWWYDSCFDTDFGNVAGPSRWQEAQHTESGAALDRYPWVSQFLMATRVNSFFLGISDGNNVRTSAVWETFL